MFKKTSVCAAVAMAFGGTLAVVTPTLAQDAAQRVEVTGSHIKRIDAETSAPVLVITREQIERSGVPTIGEMLRNLPQNSGSFGESFGNSFAPGAAGLSLRGLGQKTTLVLLNGRRMTGYGFAQNLQDTFVDVNSIPSAAVERVDILKDGASAIYGSDAIAGVVNIILRRNFQGFETSATAGRADGKNDYRVQLTGGKGDLGSDKFNVFGVLDYYKRDQLLLSETDFGASRDMRRFGGGRNHQSLTAGGTWRQLTATNGLSTTTRAISECAGKVMTNDEAVAAGLIGSVYNNTNLNKAGNTFCTWDNNGQITALPGTDRLGALGRATYEFSPETSAYVETMLSRAKSKQTFTNPFFAATTGLTETAVGLRPFTYNINFAPGVAGNPFTTNARYVGSLNDMGTRDNEITSDTVRLLAGVNTTLAKWDVDSAVGYSKNTVESMNFNRLSLAGTSAVFGVPTTAQPPVPLSTSSTYNLDQWSTNSQTVRDQMRADFPRKSTSTLATIDAKASRTFDNIQLPGGGLGLAIGAEYRREKMEDKPDPLASSGGILGQGITATNGSRNSYAIFAEAALPITKQLEAQLAARYDHYSDYGSSATPKIGVKYTPSPMLAIRANWGKGFRAPTLPEISPSVATFFTNVIDPEDGVTRSISGVFAGNPNLKAEKSTSTTLGFVFEPTDNFSMAIDFYKISWKDVVAAPDAQDVLDATCDVDRDTTVTPSCPSTSTVFRDPDTNQVVSVWSNYMNLNTRKTSGVDIDARLVMPSSVGKFTARTNFNYVHSFKEDDVEYAGSNGGTNTIPRVRGTVALDWDQGPWKVTGQANYTHYVRQDALAASWFTNQAGSVQNGTFPTHVSSRTTVDLFASYQLTKNFKISGSVINVFNQQVPYDPGFSSTYLYDFSLHDVRDRQVRLSVNYAL
jgi:iron complex outermembrane receptor protein